MVWLAVVCVLKGAFVHREKDKIIRLCLEICSSQMAWQKQKSCQRNLYSGFIFSNTCLKENSDLILWKHCKYFIWMNRTLACVNSSTAFFECSVHPPDVSTYLQNRLNCATEMCLIQIWSFWYIMQKCKVACHWWCCQKM